MIISLTGFMGCGKSSVGKALSALLCCPFIDLDSAIEEISGRTIPEIFRSDGEAAFRRMEHEVLSNIICKAEGDGRFLKQSLPSAMGPSLCGQRGSTVSKTVHLPQSLEKNMILALGGGTVMTPGCAELVHEQTLCIYLRASVDTLVSHLEGESEGRPMLSGGCHSERPESDEESALRSRIEDLMAQRSATYEKTARVIIDTDGKTIEQTAEEIFKELF